MDPPFNILQICDSHIEDVQKKYLCYSYLWKQRKGQHEDTFLHQGGSVYLLELGIHATIENKQHMYAEWVY